MLQNDAIESGTQLGSAIVEGAVAAGGMGTVYRARHASTGAPLAIKVLHASLLTADGAVARFEREARTLLALRHENVVVCHDAGCLEDGRPFIVMEWLDGPTLADVLRDHGALPLARVLPLVDQLCAGLDAAHRAGIVHRDVKPSNLVLCSGGLKIVDFGVAKLLQDAEQTRLTATGLTIGTPAYMAPEQILGRQVSAATDVYAMALVVYRALCGRHAFSATSVSEMEGAHLYLQPPPPGEIAPGLAFLDEVLLRALDKDPARRTSSAARFAAELRVAGERPRAHLSSDTVPAVGIRIDFDAAVTEERRGALRDACEAEGLQVAVDERDRMLAVTPLPYARTEARVVRERVVELALGLAKNVAPLEVSLHEARVQVLRIDGVVQVVGVG